MQMLVNSHRARALGPFSPVATPLGDRRFTLKRRMQPSRSSHFQPLIVLPFVLLNSCLSSRKKKMQKIAKEEGLESTEKARYLVDIPRYIVRNKKGQR